ncbi:hypothetical protein BK022_15720 [Methylorubrum extorquens]|uniref:Uncharacterized protein n=1 Tax=Methylorubrum extorquens TaxID=408 RepID=A0A1S1P4F0_METEX|nr:hypothetical protein BK022_15720 [Methylorubrum extorquens]
MTAPAPTDARAEARERFYRAALWHAADPGCSNALAEFEDAYEALSALSRQSLADKLGRRPTPTAAGLADGGAR